MKNKKKIQIGIVWANPYNKNLGVGALAYSALSLIADVVDEAGIDAEMSFFGSSKATPDNISINGKELLFRNIYGMDFYHWKSRIKLLFFPKRFQRSSIYQLDYIFDIAEGDSFTDIYGDRRFTRILNSKKFFSRLNKVQVLLPQTIGPFKNEDHEKAAFAAMSKLKMVLSRDKQSYDYTAASLPASQIMESIDVAFYMPFRRSSYNKEKIQVGINVSGLLWNGGYTGNNQFGMKTDYKKLIRDTLDFFTAQPGVEVHLVPHVIPLDHPVEDDFVVSEEIRKEYPGLILAPRFDTPIDAKSYISGLDFFTGARMHACIAAFSTGVPVFPMAYSRKFNGLFTDTLGYKWMGDCVNEDEQDVVEHMKSAFESREALAVAIADANRQIVKPRLDKLKQVLANVLKN